jgi:hypothetical protein
MQYLQELIKSPKDPMINFIVAQDYEKIGQLASAVSHYLIAADNSDDLAVQYHALIRLAECFMKIGKRPSTVRNLLKLALALQPDRAEAPYLLSIQMEQISAWHDSYAYACIAEKLPFLLEYPSYGPKFQRAVAAWWIGQTEEARKIMFELSKSQISPEYRLIVKNNLKSIGYPEEYSMYTPKDLLRRYFRGAENVERNFSQVFQDLFVLTAVDGARGSYLEIGSNDPYRYSNTALLEKFGWTGLSLDIDFNSVQKFARVRKNPVVLADATTYVYDLPPVMQYLQVDCEPPHITLKALKNVPTTTKFAVITFEHDHYMYPNSGIRDQSREYLWSLGYKLVVSDIAFDDDNSFEDWWIHPELVSQEIIDRIKDTSPGPKNARKYMINEI